jgi:uncharacterized repeat protein (TIGR01451 family)
MNAGVHGLWLTGALLLSLVAAPAAADEAAELAANQVSVEVPHTVGSPEGGLMCPAGQTPSRFYFNDFEGGDGGWAVTSPANLWERGAVTTGVYQTCDTTPSPEPAGAFSGTNVWATNLDGCYANLNPSQATILAQTFDFSTLSAPIMLDWQHWYHVFEAFDRAEVIVNGTVLWRTPDSNPTANYVYQAVDLSAYAGNPNVTIQFSLFSTTVVNRMGWYVDDVGISVCADPVELYINEVVYNPPGTDAPNEYIEIRGTPGATIPAGTYLVEVEGDGVPQAGTVDRVFDLGGRTLGANGYLVFLQQNNTYVVDPQATVATATGAGWTGLGGVNDIENGTVSLLLITAAAAPTIGTDVDTDNDGALDGVGATWTIVDSVGGTDGGAADLVYGAQPCGPTGFTPGSFHRIGESTGSGNTDWVCSQPFGTAPNFTLSATNTLPASFAGRALDHIGSFNFPTASISLVKTVGTDPGVCAATTAIGVNAGTTVYYCYTVTNTGNITLNLHDLTDDQLGAIFSGLNFALTPGSSIDTVTAGLSIPSVINTTTTNTATWTAYNAGPVNQATAQASATVTVLSADLAMALTDSPDPVTAGSQLSYTATVSNGGPAIAQDVSFALPLPAGTSYVSATPSAGGTCTNVSPVTCTWAGATAPMADRSATIVVLVAANVANGTNLSATATASSATTDPNAANNAATATTAVQTQADIAMTAFTDSPDPVSGRHQPDVPGGDDQQRRLGRAERALLAAAAGGHQLRLGGPERRWQLHQHQPGELHLGRRDGAYDQPQRDDRGAGGAERAAGHDSQCSRDGHQRHHRPGGGQQQPGDQHAGQCGGRLADRSDRLAGAGGTGPDGDLHRYQHQPRSVGRAERGAVDHAEPGLPLRQPYGQCRRGLHDAADRQFGRDQLHLGRGDRAGRGAHAGGERGELLAGHQQHPGGDQLEHHRSGADEQQCRQRLGAGRQPGRADPDAEPVEPAAPRPAGGPDRRGAGAPRLRVGTAEPAQGAGSALPVTQGPPSGGPLLC